MPPNQETLRELHAIAELPDKLHELYLKSPPETSAHGILTDYKYWMEYEGYSSTFAVCLIENRV